MRRKSKQQKLTWCAHKEEEATLSERDQQTTTLDEKHAHDTLTSNDPQNIDKPSRKIEDTKS